VHRHTTQRTRATVELRQETRHTFLRPTSPGLHPVDYVIWAVVQHCVYHRQIHSVDDLKLRLIDVWCDLEQSIFDETIDQWPGRCRACVHAKAGHFEYSL